MNVDIERKINKNKVQCLGVQNYSKGIQNYLNYLKSTQSQRKMNILLNT
jgi:hypothetical protein